MKRSFLSFIFCLFIASQLSAGNNNSLTKTGSTTSQFLKIQVGSRAIGMGGAYVALANDLSSIYWNPAGLAGIKGTGGVYFIHTNWLADTDFNFAAAVLNTGDFGTIGISFTSLSMPDMIVRNEFYPEGTGELFSAGDMSLAFSYARSITDHFSIGFNAKYIQNQIWHMTASTIAFDVGVLFHTNVDWLTLGISVSNFGPKMQYSGKDIFINYDYNPNEFGDSETIYANLQTDYWELPLMFRFGVAAELINEESNLLLASIEARHPNDNTESVSLGMEYGFMQRFFLRGGYQTIFEKDSEKGLTAGVGFVYFLTQSTPMKIDYAYADWNRLLDVHRFSIEILF